MTEAIVAVAIGLLDAAIAAAVAWALGPIGTFALVGFVFAGSAAYRGAKS